MLVSVRIAALSLLFACGLRAQSGPSGEEFQKAVAAQERGDFELAGRLYRELLRTHPNALPVRVNFASVLMAERAFADAVAVLLPAEAADRNNLDVAWLLGNALINAGRLLKGVTRIEQVSAHGNADACMLAAETRLNLDQYDKALKQVDAAFKINPNLAHVHTLRGMILEHTGDYGEATRELQEALQADARDSNAHLYLGAILFYQRRLQPAREHLEEAVQLDPTSPLALYQLGLVKRAQGELENATKNFAEAESRSPQWLQPHVELAALYYILQRPQDGLRERKIVDELSAAPKSSPQPLRIAAP